jgi:hypothetical protein
MGLTDTDIHEAVRWIADNAKGRRSSLWAVIRMGDRAGLIRFAGTDSTASAGTYYPSRATHDAGS